MTNAIPTTFGERLSFALKTINLSPAALGSAVGVDKSVVSRWLSGKVQPSGHNRARISIEIARHRPNFSALAFESPPDKFLWALGIAPTEPAAPVADPGSLPIPYDLVDDARHEVARRGDEYFGHYSMYYWSFSQPGRIAKMNLMLRPALGLIEARYGATGFEFRGWALLLLNRLYIQLAEMRFEAMAFIVTNAGQQPGATIISGILLGPSDRLLIPTASEVLFVRDADVSGDTASDDEAFEKRRSFDPLAEGDRAPASIRRILSGRRAADTPAGGGPALFQMPYVAPEELFG